MTEWAIPPDDWPADVPWPPPIWPHRLDAWKMRGWAGRRELAGSPCPVCSWQHPPGARCASPATWPARAAELAEARRALLMTAPAEGCYPP